MREREMEGMMGFVSGVETWPIGEIETYGNSTIANIVTERNRSETTNS